MLADYGLPIIVFASGKNLDRFAVPGISINGYACALDGTRSVAVYPPTAAASKAGVSFDDRNQALSTG